MLGQLHIKNIGIIDEITINFEDGLNVLTGETGAGKSLIIDSINAITGSKISKNIIKTGEDMALVEACFFDGDETKIVTREIYQNGRSICKIDGRMTTLAETKAVGECLIDVHGQHDNQSLLNEKNHIELLDKFAEKDLENYKNEYIQNLEEFKIIENKIKDSYGDPASRARRIDLLKYQKEEIENADLKEREEENLESKRNLLMNSEKILRSITKAHDILNENTIDGLSGVIHEISCISEIDKKYNNALTVANDAYYSLKEMMLDLANYSDEVSIDEEEQNKIEERLDLIFSLKRKYGNTIEDILKYCQKTSEELEFLENSDEIVKKLKEELSNKDSLLKNLAQKIRKIRKEKAKIIEKNINDQLKDLEMKNAYIEFNFSETEKFLDNGMDIVKILICTNLGEGLKPLCNIASGGEISRVMLAMKTVLSEYDEIPTMIFDEIDSGISGEAGIAVAEKMKAIGKTHQILVVTHLPVIAAAGDANYFIEKNTKNNKTYTVVNKLNEEETIKEVARILVGKNITKSAFEHAEELRMKMK